MTTPEEEFQRLTETLDLDPDPGLMAAFRAHQKSTGKAKSGFYSTIKDQSFDINHWQSQLNETLLKLVENSCWNFMSLHGYENHTSVVKA